MPSRTMRRLDFAEHSFTNEEEFVGADSDFSVASGPWPALVGDQALPNSTSDSLVGEVKVGSEVSHRPPCLGSCFKGSEPCEMVPGLHAVRIEQIHMLANEAIEINHVEKPSGLRASPGPAAPDQQARFDAPANNGAVVQSEDSLDVP